VLKKLFKAAATLALLVGCYFGYVHAFAIVVEHFREIRKAEDIIWRAHDSNSKKESIAFAHAALGHDHWATASDLGYRYYNAERGYWMYAKECERIVEEDGVRYDGKRIRLKPFALISKSRDGKKTQTVTSDVAIFDLNEPLGFNPNASGEPLKVVHARLEQNIWIRDDKSTPADLSDDMKIGPLTTVDYDEPTQQISTNSYVVIHDPEMVATGDGMLIQLRKDETPGPKGSSGFDGAERLDLLKNVHVVMHDVGQSGMLPGSAKTRRTTAGKVEAQAQRSKPVDGRTTEPAPLEEPTPLDVKCDSKMQVHLPKPRPPVAVGPPAPAEATIVTFDRNVVVLRGQLDDQPDQLTCDTLRLSLVPGETTAQSGGPLPEKQSLFGNLTLERARATGHVVWLYLPSQGIKIRCNEMIHARQIPIKPDTTYFRGDLTRMVEIEKVDIAYDEDDELDPGTVTSVTYVWSFDATLLDSGTGMDTADVVAHGPGRLETRADRDQPLERIAIWQDKFILKNELGPEGQVLHKIIDLTGNRPCFVDKLQDTLLDSAQLIKVTLKPKPNKLQIERLVAVRDVHLIAPAKTMNAKEQLWAEFFEAEAPAVGSAKSSKAADAPTAPASNLDQTQTQEQEQEAPKSPEELAAQDQEESKSNEPPMVGTAERIWAKVALTPKPATDEKPDNQTAEPKTAATFASERPGKTKTRSKTSRTSDTNAEIRKAWLWGNVALHQEPAEGKTKGQDATGEALYLDNRGPGKAFTQVYQRDPTETTYLPGPLPPAWVENEDVVITAAGVLNMNQQTDQAWVEGPGTLTQLAARGFLTDRAPDAGEEANAPAGADRTDAGPAVAAARPAIEADSKSEKRHDTSVTQRDTGTDPDPAMDQAADSKPKTRAGRPVTEKVPMVIGFSDSMYFAGKTRDPEGRPAARADFYGMVTAEMEDALLHSEEKMIAYTDQEVPLAQLGAMSQAQSKPKPALGAATPANEDVEPEPKPQISLIYGYRNAVAISRKVDPDSPRVLQQQRIEADDILAYDRRTGDFQVPGKGKVFLYDRGDDPAQAPGANGDGDNKGDRQATTTTTQRTVTPTSSRVPNSAAASSAPSTKMRTTARSTPEEPATKELPPLVLTQIHFAKGMIGRFGSGKENDKTDTRWAEFYGNVEAARAKVRDTRTMLNQDKLPPDGFFLTGQTLRVITEPPPVGSPPSTPARNYLKAWENAYVSSSDKIIQADTVTYDSYKDLIYAYGEHGRGVIYAQQQAPGQPTSPGAARAVQLNPKTGKLHLIDSDTVRVIDKNTGVRPSPALAPDPYAKPKKRIKRPYRLPPGNMERRGFTGQ
jgi:hypothetical protein